MTYRRQVTRRNKFIIMLILLSINTILCIIPVSTTQIVVTLFGSFTSPLVIFVIPGYLFYDQLQKSGESSIHKSLSLAMTTIGVVLLLVMTTISFYVIRIDLYSKMKLN